jgi:putative transposase
VTLPRDVRPGRFYLVTRRCTQRVFLLRPYAATNNNVLYCLAIAAERSGVEVLLPCAMSNHYHAVVYDRHGNLPEFTEHFHKLLAKSQNALRGRWENLWASEQVCVVRLEGFDDVVAKLVYVATNPVKDGLVDKVHHWPGFHGLGALLADRPMTARRPAHFFRADGPMPASATLRLTVPRELGEADQVRAELRTRVAEAERALAEARERDGRRVVGRRAVLDQP